MTEETALKSQVKDYLRWTNWFCFHLLQGLGNFRGAPDLIAIKEGRVLFIELKSKKGKQSPYQIEFQEEIENHKGEYILIRSLDELMIKLKDN